MSSLYIVGTPIGNLEDITFRAVGVLSSVDLIVCEDTRVTARLLLRYSIETLTMSLHARSAVSKMRPILSLLDQGKNVAFVSDAGTPAVSDPGALLVATVRHTLPQVRIVAVPGPSALTAALSIAGFSASDFLFLGFLPHKKGREKLFSEIAVSKRTVIFYESPHRIKKTLDSLKVHLDPGREMCIGRELTKMHEELVAGSVAELVSYFEKNPDKVRGEFVVIVEGV